jgi:L-rhamnose mutarotase
VPDELRALFDRAGIRDWTIWRSGDRLFHLVECEDFEEAMRVIRADEADQRWQENIGRFIDGFLGPDGAAGYAPLDQVWRLEEQRAAGASGSSGGAAGAPGSSGGAAEAANGSPGQDDPSRPTDRLRRPVIDDMGLD